DDADDSERREVAVHIAELHELAERILAWPLALDERAAHHGDVLGAWPVGGTEQPPAKQRNAERCEVALARDAILREARSPRITLPERVEVVERLDLVGPTLLDDHPAPRPAGQRRGGDAARDGYARQPACTLDQLLVNKPHSRRFGRIGRN